nr:F20B24.14 [Arabidopsis thaliana]
MKSSHIALLCIVVLSLFALHECKFFIHSQSLKSNESCRCEQGGQRHSQKVNEACVPGPCHPLVPHCWCCEHLRGIRPQCCWSGSTGRDYCNQQSSNRRRNAEDSSEIYRWTIGFARFVHYPSSPSPHPVLKPLGKREQYHSPHGTWLSASSSTVSLHIVDELNRSDVILSVKLGQKVLIQKFALRFSTCDAALEFVEALKEKIKGLKEASTQNQKNKTRCDVSFQSDYNPSDAIIPRATQKEPNMVRPLNSYVPEMLPRIVYEAQYQKSETRSEVSFQSDYNPSIEIFPRLDHIYSVVNLYKCLSQPFRHGKFFSAEPLRKSQICSVPEVLPRPEYEAGQALYPSQSTLNQIPSLPPSFTTLLSGCFPDSTLDAGQTTVKQNPDLKSQILVQYKQTRVSFLFQHINTIQMISPTFCFWQKYMEDSSFQGEHSPHYTHTQTILTHIDSNFTFKLQTSLNKSF